MSSDSILPAGPLTIWCDPPFPERVLQDMRRRLEPHRLVTAGADGAVFADAQVAVGQPDPRLVVELPKLRWVQLTTAGYTRYDTAEVRNALGRRGGALTNSSGVYDEPCAQHVLAMMMALARQLPAAWQDQHGPRQWPQHRLRTHARLLNGQTAMLYGYGAIARRLTELLLPLRMNLIGVRRSPTGTEPIRVLASESADEWLGRADHVVNLLPAASGTEAYFDARRIRAIKAGAIFYNIGRGSTVDQHALVSALQNGQLAAAFLDVTDPEPLPPEHPLWPAPNCWITPHAAGGHADEPERLAEHFLENLQRFVRGEALINKVF